MVDEQQDAGSYLVGRSWTSNWIVNLQMAGDRWSKLMVLAEGEDKADGI